jgi:hypothetical protein
MRSFNVMSLGGDNFTFTSVDLTKKTLISFLFKDRS